MASRADGRRQRRDEGAVRLRLRRFPPVQRMGLTACQYRAAEWSHKEVELRGPRPCRSGRDARMSPSPPDHATGTTKRSPADVHRPRSVRHRGSAARRRPPPRAPTSRRRSPCVPVSERHAVPAQRCSGGRNVPTATTAKIHAFGFTHWNAAACQNAERVRRRALAPPPRSARSRTATAEEVRGPRDLQDDLRRRHGVEDAPDPRATPTTRRAHPERRAEDVRDASVRNPNRIPDAQQQRVVRPRVTPLPRREARSRRARSRAVLHRLLIHPSDAPAGSCTISRRVDRPPNGSARGSRRSPASTRCSTPGSWTMRTRRTPTTRGPCSSSTQGADPIRPRGAHRGGGRGTRVTILPAARRARRARRRHRGVPQARALHRNRGPRRTADRPGRRRARLSTTTVVRRTSVALHRAARRSRRAARGGERWLAARRRASSEMHSGSVAAPLERAGDTSPTSSATCSTSDRFDAADAGGRRADPARVVGPPGAVLHPHVRDRTAPLRDRSPHRRGAARLLDGEPVAMVASGVGFHDQAHLTRHFKRHVGTTPARYAATSGAGRAGPACRRGIGGYPG